MRVLKFLNNKRCHFISYFNLIFLDYISNNYTPPCHLPQASFLIFGTLRSTSIFFNIRKECTTTKVGQLYKGRKGKEAHIFDVFMKQLITQETLNPKTKFKGILNHLGWIDNTCRYEQKNQLETSETHIECYKRDVFCTYPCWVGEYLTLLSTHVIF